MHGTCNLNKEKYIIRMDIAVSTDNVLVVSAFIEGAKGLKPDGGDNFIAELNNDVFILNAIGDLEEADKVLTKLKHDIEENIEGVGITVTYKPVFDECYGCD